MTVINLSDIETALLQLIAGVIMLGIIWLLTLLKTRLHLNISAAQQAQLEDVADKSLAAGIALSTKEIKAKGWDHAEVKSDVVAAAGTYAVAKFPDVIKASGINMTDPMATASGLATGIMSRKFADAVTVAAASPATPPAIALPITDSQQATENRMAAALAAPSVPPAP